MTDSAISPGRPRWWQRLARPLAQTPYVAGRPRDRSTLLALALVAIGTPLALGAAFRWFGFGVDYPNYILFFYYLPPGFEFGSDRFEPGFQLLCKLVKYGFGMDLPAVMFIMVGSSLLIKFRIFYQYTSRPLLAVLIYILFFYPLQEYTQVRTALATGLAFMAVIRTVERRYLSALLLFALAFAFHYTIAAVAGVAMLAPLGRNKVVLAMGAMSLLFVGVTPALRDVLAGTFAALNPLSDSYLYASGVSLNLFSAWNVAGVFAILFALVVGLFDRDRLVATMVVMTAAGLALTILFRDTIDFALRMRDIFGLAPILLVTRADPEELTLIPALLLLAAAALTFGTVSYGDTIFGG